MKKLLLMKMYQAFGFRLQDDCKLTINWKKDNDVTICRHDVILKFFDATMLLFSNVVIGLSFMSLSWLVVELWQFLFIKDWPEIQKLEIPSPAFCPVSGHWDELRIPNFTRMSIIKSYWMLQNGRVTAFIVSELLRENQQWD